MRTRDLRLTDELLQALHRGPVGIAALERQLGVTRRTVLRWLSEREDVCVVGSASRTRYALRRPLRGRLESYPVYCIDRQGQAIPTVDMSLVFPSGSLYDMGTLQWPVDQASRDGWWDGLPYPIYDMRPQGFLGRTFARHYHGLLDVSPDPRNWSDDDILYILTRVGWDMPGNLLIGDATLQRWHEELAHPAPAIAASELEQQYLMRARDVASLGMAGGSAAGEFPKFTALRELAQAETEHVIVKFSGEAIPGATQRWADLLICEHLASGCVARLPGVASARTRIVQCGQRTFLESERFDRVGRFGRRPLVSLESVNGHLLGTAGEDWRQPLRKMAELKLISLEEGEAALRIWWFGKLIANTDMHMGNLSFYPEAGRFRLAPVYDMLPMAYAPLPGGELPQPQAGMALPMPGEREAWFDACECASAFWREAAGDARISAEFRMICDEREKSLHSLRQRVVPQ